MRRILPVAAALVLVLAGCSSAPKSTEENNTNTEAIEETVEDGEVIDEGESIDWQEAATAEDAAKGAGFDKFGVLDKFTIGDLEFKDPTFSYAGNVAQATYETPATAVYIRKAVDTYTVPLSDRDLDEFPARWYKVYEGTEVTCYGVAKGAVTVAYWTDKTTSYAITFQGLGGEEMSMDSDELATLVKGIKEANADQKAEEKKEEAKKEETKDESQKTALLSAHDAELKAEQACNGNCTSIDRMTTKQYGDCWYAICVGANGNRFEYYVNNNGVYLIKETTAQKEQTKPSTSDGHYEGEPVTIYDSVYAEWHKANDGVWYATFITFNNTQVFAKPAPAGGEWVFYAIDSGKMVQIYYSDQESSVTGQYGPAGVSSHWLSMDGSKWY